MLLITKATTNYLAVTCQEKQLLTNPYYLLHFHNESTKDDRYCIASDTSAYPARFQYLTIIETTTPTASTNQIKLDTTGAWFLKIYEQASSTNIVTTGLTEVHREKAWVLHTASTMSEYSSFNTTYVGYNGY